jgi:transposase-like protein
MNAIDHAALAALEGKSRRLTPAQRVAILALHRRDRVPVPILARAFGVKDTAIYYITHWKHTKAHQRAAAGLEAMGERVWTEIVTQDQIDAVNRVINEGIAA